MSVFAQVNTVDIAEVLERQAEIEAAMQLPTQQTATLTLS